MNGVSVDVEFKLQYKILKWPGYKIKKSSFRWCCTTPKEASSFALISVSVIHYKPILLHTRPFRMTEFMD